jgi:hypothetical protein
VKKNALGAGRLDDADNKNTQTPTILLCKRLKNIVVVVAGWAVRKPEIGSYVLILAHFFFSVPSFFRIPITDLQVTTD